MPSQGWDLSTDEGWARMELASTSVDLRVEEYFVPDVGLPSGYAGPEVVVSSFAGRVAVVGRAAPGVVRETSIDEASAIAQAARDVIAAGSVSGGADTAIGRTLTTLLLRLRGARGDRSEVGATINHAAPRELPEAWSHLLRVLDDGCGELPEAHEEGWQRALRWTMPLALGERFAAGHVVKLPHRRNALAYDEGLYLRTGQPPGPSHLYRLERSPRLRLDELVGDDVVPVDLDRPGPLLLPCGGAAIGFRRRVGRGSSLEVHVLDAARGVYAERS
ncbi:MAG: hypothetical protein R3B82_11965 [Sandaracinaceae bacterium]